MAQATKTPSLGKGLAALMGDTRPNSASGAASGPPREIGIDLLDPNPFQPRDMSDETGLQELADSIRAQGILQPILVRPHPTDAGRYQIIGGERRWRAAGLVGLHVVPVYVRTLNDHESAAAALVENLQRKDLNPIEEAEGMRRLIDEFGYTHDGMGAAIGKSRPHVSNMLRLLQLPDKVRQSVRAGELSFAHARTIINHPDPVAVAKRIVDRGLSLRQVEMLMAREASDKSRKPRKPADANLRAMEAEIADILGLATSLKLNAAGRGTIVISIENWEQLEGFSYRVRIP
jgi:ParB family chromosome partitioning protein